jgi:hypothetical protein
MSYGRVLRWNRPELAGKGLHIALRAMRLGEKVQQREKGSPGKAGPHLGGD